jgi:hypothetical protein
MRPRPLIRWKSFWLGILVLGFLGWARVRSMEREDHIAWGYSRGECISLEQAAGRLFLYRGYNPYSVLGLTYVPSTFLHGESAHKPVALMYSPVGWRVEAAHWFLMLLFLLPWLAFLAWRVRKQRRPIL